MQGQQSSNSQPRAEEKQDDLESGGQNPDSNNNNSTGLLYKLEDTPPWSMSCILGFQHYLTMFGGTASIPFIICPLLCIEDDDPARGYIISTIFFVSGIITLLQTTFGVRLPIIQGTTFTFLAPTFAILSLEQNACPADFAVSGWGNISQEEKTEQWQQRMRLIQGSVAVASIFQVVIGYCGIIGILLKFITPLTIAPSVTMIGLGLFEVASRLSSQHWGIALGTVILMTLFSQYLRNVTCPVVGYQRNRGCFRSRIDIFKLFPVLMAIMIMWALCAILTLTGVFPEDSPARTDTKLSLLINAAWFRVPYPLQWGIPSVSAAGVFGMLAGILASAIESVGDYYACARLCQAPPPPVHAINRGIGTEGIGCIIAALWGTGNGTTSYSENVAAIGVTKVASRRVIMCAAIIMIFFGLVSKFGALFLTIPQPIVGGMFMVMFGMITAVGVSNLQFVDLNSTRNLFVVGFALFFGLVMPKWMESAGQVIQTGSDVLDQVITVLLKTSMFVSGAVGFFLDNTIPGTDEERGLHLWRSEATSGPENGAEQVKKCYDLPFGLTDLLNRTKWAKYVPFLPGYEVRTACGCTGKKFCFASKVAPK